ncbi:hypothetical protein G9A89_019647 [Geosiphon pyriformis]|nr:hypothetical protein G9A89_019647 [Geosiphon pyriformis]
MTKDNQAGPERIILNIGGQKYETYRSTLTAYPDTFLGTMFQERNRCLLHPANENEFFFDRNSRAFHYILEYYRTGEILFDETSSYTGMARKELEKELDFWQIPYEKEDPFTLEITEASQIVEDFLNMLRSVINEPKRYLRTKINLVFPLFNFALFTIEPKLGTVVPLVEQYAQIGYPISRELGKALVEQLKIDFPGLDCELNAEGSGPSDWRYRWEFVIPLKPSFDDILKKVNLKMKS